jgi:hypothetical protein
MFKSVTYLYQRRFELLLADARDESIERGGDGLRQLESGGRRRIESEGW